MSASVQSLEDAANIAAEFIYSLENTPNEIRHILEEIRHKDSRVQELQNQIDSESARWIRHTLRDASNNTGSGSAPSSPTKSVGHLPAKIKQSYAEIEQLSADKLALAERVVELMTRTSTRLGVDLNRARVLQGEDLTEVTSTGASTGGLPSVNASMSLAGAIGESLKQALSANVASENRHSTPASAPPPKKRKVNTSAAHSIKLPPSRSISPAAPLSKAASHTRSRLSRQTYPPPRRSKIEEPDEEEEEQEEPEAEEHEDEDDDHKLYCFCQKPSAGDMIACDNTSGCPYEWFHLECVGITEPPDTQKWYCPICIDKVSVRKGRKKN